MGQAGETTLRLLRVGEHPFSSRTVTYWYRYSYCLQQANINVEGIHKFPCALHIKIITVYRKVNFVFARNIPVLSLHNSFMYGRRKANCNIHLSDDNYDERVYRDSYLLQKSLCRDVCLGLMVASSHALSMMHLIACD